MASGPAVDRRRVGAEPDPRADSSRPTPARGEDFESQIADLARGSSTTNDALVIFPEGGNFTPSGAAGAGSNGYVVADSTGWPTVRHG